MKIYAKSKLDDNIFDKIKKGADGVELHLDEDFVNTEDYWDQNIIDSVPIIGVHMPLIEHVDHEIEYPHNRQLLYKTAAFAYRIAKEQNHNVTVICHLSIDPVVLKRFGLYESLVFLMRDLANTFENISFAVENVMSIRNINDEDRFLRAMRYNSNVLFVKDVNHPRVGTCIDTCHAMMEIDSRRMLREYFGKCTDYKYDLNMEMFFAENKDTIKWIHLSNSEKHGFGSYHGMPFTEKEKDKLEYIISLYRKYEYDCPIILEVVEDDYSNALNFEITSKTLRSLENKKRAV